MIKFCSEYFEAKCTNFVYVMIKREYIYQVKDNWTEESDM